MNAIEIKNITKRFIIPHEKRDTMREFVVSGFARRQKDYLYALDDISFSVRKGEFFGIIGRNGSGKSTLLKVIAGIIPVDKGSVQVVGKISPFLELGVGFNPELSARDNIYLNGTVLGLSRAEIEAEFDNILKFAELEKFVDQKLKNFSSGMQVRLAFSVAIKAKADVYLMDEVLAVGDMAFQQKCFEVFRRFKKQGKTLVYVSHDLGSIRQFCDRCLYLKGGRIIASGQADKVLDKYIYEDRASEVDATLSGNKQLQEVQKRAVENPVEIKGARFIDKFGNDNTTIIAGNSGVIQVSYDFRDEIANPVFGIMLKNDSGELLFGTNTEIREVKFDRLKGGFGLDFRIERIPLKEGVIHVTAAVREKGSTQTLVWRDDLMQIHVVNPSQDIGLLDLDLTITPLDPSNVYLEIIKQKGKHLIEAKAINFYKEKDAWDVMLLIDACRYDTFKKINKLKGHLQKKISPGSCTIEWFRETFVPGRYDDLIYISANPFISRLYFQQANWDVDFLELEELWDSQWDEKLKTVPPHVVCGAMKQQLHRLPEKKLFVHFIQPHHPFIGKNKIAESGWELSRNVVKGEGANESEDDIYKKMREGKVSIKDAMRAYESNLELVLEEISKVLHGIKGRVVIASDHGDCFGEYGLYAHPEATYVPELIEVPWFEVDMEQYHADREDLLDNLDF